MIIQDYLNTYNTNVGAGAGAECIQEQGLLVFARPGQEVNILMSWVGAVNTVEGRERS